VWGGGGGGGRRKSLGTTLGAGNGQSRKEAMPTILAWEMLIRGRGKK